MTQPNEDKYIPVKEYIEQYRKPGKRKMVHEIIKEVVEKYNMTNSEAEAKVVTTLLFGDHITVQTPEEAP